MGLYLIKSLFLSLAALVVLLPSNQGGASLSGWLSAYDRQPSEATMAYRCQIGDLDCHNTENWADVYIAVADCSYIGKRATVVYDSGLTLDAIVFDCAGVDGVDENGEAYITNSGIVAELDYASWQAYGLGKATIIFE